MKKLWILFALLLVFVPVTVAQDSPDAESTFWWNDRVFYEIFVRSFQDSDGDGVGDLQGVISKLDYLNDGDPTTDTDLGITGIWLMPIMQSPSYHGYDVTDYRTIEEDYGTNEDFKQLVEAAHQRGIAVVVDMVINHTSREHPWFVDAQNPGSAYNSWYRWSQTNPGYLGPWGQQVWHRAGNRYYYGVFWEGMPDLNVRNPAVTQELYSIADFWLNEMGADGFRMDAIKHMIEEDRQQENTNATLNWLENWNDYIDQIAPDALTIGEIFGGGPVAPLYVPDKMDAIFEFGFAEAVLNAARTGRSSSMRSNMNRIRNQYPPGQYATFITNHDQNRSFFQLGEDVDKAKIAAGLLLTSPGVPFIYYGEELGMIGKKPDECIRTPMQWEAEIEEQDFMRGKGCQTNEAEFNLAAQIDDLDSLFNHYLTLIHLRNDHPALLRGGITLVDSSDDSVYSFIRSTPEETVLVVVNLSDEPVADYTLSLEEGTFSGEATATLLLGQGEPAAPQFNATGGFDAYTPLSELPPYSTTVIQLS